MHFFVSVPMPPPERTRFLWASASDLALTDFGEVCLFHTDCCGRKSASVSVVPLGNVATFEWPREPVAGTGDLRKSHVSFAVKGKRTRGQSGDFVVTGSQQSAIVAHRT